MDGDAITAARTAAGSRLATRLLARGHVLAVIGTGVQGAAHLTALRREQEWAEIRVWGRREERARDLAARHDAAPFASVEEAVARADVVCIATPATEPVLLREWLAPGAHVNSVGYSTAGRELDPALVRDALVVVESRESALAPPPAGSTDLEEAQDALELGELVAGRPGRTTPEQLTLYKSVGVAVEDDAAAALALRGAEERELGTVVEL
jgi:ornithine cyclodeaminase